MRRLVLGITLSIMFFGGTTMGQIFQPHVGISGSLWNEVPKGDWVSLPEQAIVFLRTEGDEIWLFNFEPGGREGENPILFQSLLMKESGAEMGRFVSLDYKHVQETKYLSWDEIKVFSREGLSKKNWTDLQVEVERYLRRKNLLQ